MMPRKLSKIARIFSEIEYIKTKGSYFGQQEYDLLVLMYSISENILAILGSFLGIIIQFLFQKMSTAIGTLVEDAMKLSRAFCSSFLMYSPLSNTKQF